MGRYSTKKQTRPYQWIRKVIDQFVGPIIFKNKPWILRPKCLRHLQFFLRSSNLYQSALKIKKRWTYGNICLLRNVCPGQRCAWFRAALNALKPHNKHLCGNAKISTVLWTQTLTIVSRQCVTGHRNFPPPSPPPLLFTLFNFPREGGGRGEGRPHLIYEYCVLEVSLSLY